MLIVCPNCATSYRVEPSSLGATGRSVRCVRCRTVWFVRVAGAAAAVAGDYRTETAALTASASATDLDLAPTPVPSADSAEPDLSPPALEAVEAEQPEAIPADAPALSAADPADVEWHGDDLPSAQTPVAVADALVAPPIEHDGAMLRAEALPAEDIETVAARRMPRKPARRLAPWLPPALPTAILVLVALNAALIGWRADVVRLMPQTASLYAAIGLPINLRGLAFANVASATETHDGVPVLVVEGTIVSTKDRATEVPRLRFAVRNQNGQEVYAWTALPGRSVLAPGETLSFRSRLASPPPDAHHVQVRFFNRRDRVAGIQ
jgi:predicted Zn finger-like uncharacterized protein